MSYLVCCGGSFLLSNYHTGAKVSPSHGSAEHCSVSFPLFSSPGLLTSQRCVREHVSGGGGTGNRRENERCPGQGVFMMFAPLRDGSVSTTAGLLQITSRQ